MHLLRIFFSLKFFYKNIYTNPKFISQVLQMNVFFSSFWHKDFLTPLLEANNLLVKI